eukprot:6196831-Pleurochrysis_carterae.AAC.1
MVTRPGHETERANYELCVGWRVGGKTERIADDLLRTALVRRLTPRSACEVDERHGIGATLGGRLGCCV